MPNRIKRIAVFLLLVCLILLPLLAVKVRMDNASSSKSAVFVKDWAYRYSGEWNAIDNPRNPPGRDGDNILWLRTVLPNGDWSDPCLVAQMYHKFELYSDQGLIYRFGDMSEAGSTVYEGNPPRIIPVPAELLGKPVYFRVFSNQRYIGILNEAYVDSKADVILHWFRSDTDQVVIGSFYLMFAIVGVFLYGFNRTQPYFLSFSGFTLLLGLNTISRLNVIYLLYDHSLFWKYVELTCFYLGETCLIAFLAHFLGGGWKGMLRKLWIVHLLYTLLAIPLNAMGWVHIPASLFIYQLLLGVSILIVLLQICYYAKNGSSEARIVMVGLLALCVFGGIDLCDSLLFGEWELPSLNDIGLLYFIATLFYVLVRRLLRINLSLHNAQKLTLVGQLAAGVAHEIRNPVTVLTGFLSLMQKGSANKNHMAIMKSELERINAIVSDFLQLAKPASPLFKPYRLDNILNETATMFEAHAYAKGIEIQRQFDKELPEVVCDCNQLKQVFINLVKNAIEAMDNPGRLRIQAHCASHDAVVIRFSDQGRGIPEADLNRIGEPFYTTKNGGTGLGIMICQNIIASHGGTLQIFSKLHEGTTFEITLPLSPAGAGR